MSDIRISVGANADAAKRSIKEIGKDVKELQKDALNVKIGTETGTSSRTGASPSSGSDSTDRLIETIERLTNSLDKANSVGASKNPSPLNNGSSGSTGGGSIPILDNLGKIGTIIGATKGALSYFSNNAKQAAAFEKRSLDVYNRLGAYGNDFNKPRSGATNLGKKYGFDTGEVIGLQDSIARGGFRSTADLASTSEDFMKTKLAFGIDANSLAYDYAGLRKRNLQGLSAEDYTNTIGTNIAAGGMKGREDEVARSLADITDTITRGKLEVSSDDFKVAAGLQAQLARQNPALKGEKGAELISKMQNGFNEHDMTTLRLFGYGGELGYGKKGLMAATKRAEKGLSDPEGAKAFYNNLQRETGGDKDMAVMYTKQIMGLSNTEEAEEVLKLLSQDSLESYKKANEEYGKGGDKEKNLDFATSSKALSNFNYELERASANLASGNVYNAGTSPLKKAYNALPQPLQSGLNIAGTVAAGATVGKVVGSVPKLLAKGLKGAEGGAEAASGISKFLPGLFKGGKGVAEGAEGVAKGASALSKASKFAKVAGGVGIAVDAISHGYEAYGHFKKGETKEGIGAIGGGVGSIGGALGGAKLGAVIGTLAGPAGTVIGGGIGAIVGGLGGEWLGRKAGKSLAPTKAYADEIHKERKDKDLVGRQELVVKREENILDRIEAGDMFNINIDNKGLEGKKANTGQGIQAKSDYALARENALNALNGGPMAGGVGGVDGPSGPLTGDGNSQKIWNYFKGKGFSNAGIAGIMANLYHESGYDPAIKQNGGGPGRGLAQWEGPRFTALQEFARGRSKSWTDLQTQLDFIMHEMKTNHSASFINSFKTSNDAYQSAANFENQFEKPKHNHNAERGATARKILEENKTIVANNSSLSQSAKKNVSAYAVGTDRVTEDQLAYLHKDEAVLSKHDAKSYRERSETSTSTGTININLNVQGGSGVPDLTEKFKEMIIMAAKQLSSNNQQFKLNQVYQRRPN
ncbi:phage tail tip lysozyme [Anaerococcus sp. NML200537]|uniref:phage tail tip lysozyme n=1 Tax=Anaerococcus sp. NML200537 TaxID=2954485 RepID=UPI002238A852|nr:phage tail tip lysozyme [Anaerococcus sp. NML200537]MCW6701383.1 phage tail tip lysozyme [Anaerococcus sp. NML200537]